MPEFVQTAGRAREPEFAPLLSVVVPVRNEGPNILPLIGEIRAALAGRDYEILYVDDGSLDDTQIRLREAALAGAPLRWLRHRRSCGQSAAIVTGVRQAAGSWVATLDGDGQNDPADIPVLLGEALARDTDARGPVLVAGHRTRRQDGTMKRIASRIANEVRARLLGDGTPDTGCGLKVFRREAFLALPHFDHMHRFLPALFLRAGGQVVSVPVNHRARQRGRSNYGTLDRLGVGIFDVAGLLWLQRRWSRPEIEDSGGLEASATIEGRAERSPR
jgi:dolichol-phosphate mannosyltransferase